MARVLLVDDEERILASLQRSLRRDGYEIVTACSPQEALQILEEQDFDAVLTDHKMPGMTGVELLARVARLQKARAHGKSGRQARTSPPAPSRAHP